MFDCIKRLLGFGYNNNPRLSDRESDSSELDHWDCSDGPNYLYPEKLVVSVDDTPVPFVQHIYVYSTGKEIACVSLDIKMMEDDSIEEIYERFNMKQLSLRAYNAESFILNPFTATVESVRLSGRLSSPFSKEVIYSITLQSVKEMEDVS